MNERTEAAISAAAALFVLFTAPVDPVISASLAVAFLAALAGYRWWRGRAAG